MSVISFGYVWDLFQHGSHSQRLKLPLVMQSPPARTNTSEDPSLTKLY
ncbi:hypothetical protein [Chamaesiphon sp.]